MINQVIFLNNELFDKNFSLAGGEDIDFCINLIRKGYILTGYDDISIMHYFGRINILISTTG